MPDDTQVETAPDTTPDSGSSETGGTLASLAAPPEPSTGGGVLGSALASDQAPRTVPNVQNIPTSTPPEPLKGLGGRLRGVLYGLATGGAVGGVAGAIAPNTARDIFQTRRQEAHARADTATAAATSAQQNIQFESVKAADSHVLAMKQAQNYDRLNEQSRAEIRKMNDEHAQFLMDNFGILPDLTIEGNGQEVHDQASGALNTLAGENGGSIPPVAVNVLPHDGQNSKFTVQVHAPSQQDLVKNQQGYRKLVDTANAVKGLPAMDDTLWTTLGWKGQREAALQAMQFLSPDQPFTEQNLPAVLAQRKQQLAAYQQHTNQNGQPDADPNVVQALSRSVDFLQKSSDDLASTLAQRKAAEEKATLPYELAKTRATAEARMSLEGMAKPVYAFNPQTSDRELMSQTEAIAKGYKVMTPVTEKEVGEDIQLANRLGDVHQKISQYQGALDRWLGGGNAVNRAGEASSIAGLLSSDKLKVGAFGVELPVDRLNQLADKFNIKTLSPEARDVVVSFYNAREALTGYNRVLTGSGRVNEKTLELQLQTLPSPVSADKDYADRSIAAFKQNLNVVDQGIPRIPGVKHPSEWEAAQGNQATPGTVKLKAPNGQIKEVPSSQADHYKKLGATVVP